MGEPFAGSPITFNQGSGHRICKESVFPKVHQIKKTPEGVFLFGGPEGIRTLGLRDANAALSQLSHGPILQFFSNCSPIIARLPAGVKTKVCGKAAPYRRGEHLFCRRA